MHEGWALIAGFGALLFLCVVYWVMSGEGGNNPLEIVTGADGRPSTSKLQIFVWTIVVVFAYVALQVHRFSFGFYNGLPNGIPQNVAIALGLSATTWVTAKAITSSQDKNGTVNKNHRPAAGIGAIFQDDAGYPDLGKVQLLVWTVIALAVFLTQVIHQLHVQPTKDTGGMPDIDNTLMILMGLGQGAYLGKKLVTTDPMRVTSINPTSGPVGTSITLGGSAFGTEQGGSKVTIDGALFPGEVDWTENQLKFTFPELDPKTRTAWEKPTQTVDIGVISIQSPAMTRKPSTVQFTVTEPS